MQRLSDKRGLARAAARRTFGRSRGDWPSGVAVYTHDPAEADEVAENLWEAIRDRVA